MMGGHENQWNDAVSSVDDVGCGDVDLMEETISGSEMSFQSLEVFGNIVQGRHL